MLIPLTFEKSFDTSHLFHHLCKFGILGQKFLDISCWHARPPRYSLDPPWLLTENLGAVSAVELCRQGPVTFMNTQLPFTVEALTSKDLTYTKTNTMVKPPARFNKCCYHLLCLPLIFKNQTWNIFKRVFIIFISYKNNKANTHILTLQKNVFSLKKLFVHPFHISSPSALQNIYQRYISKSN